MARFFPFLRSAFAAAKDGFCGRNMPFSQLSKTSSLFLRDAEVLEPLPQKITTKECIHLLTFSTMVREMRFAAKSISRRTHFAPYFVMIRWECRVGSLRYVAGNAAGNAVGMQLGSSRRCR